MTDDKTKTDVRRGMDCIGVAVSFLIHDGNGKIFLHKRSERCRDERGKWDTGGGALEFGETFEQCLHREVHEEFGDVPQDIRLLGVLNVLREHEGTPTHWISICYAVRLQPERIVIGEPEKVDEAGWFSPDDLPTPEHTTLRRWVQRAKEAGIFTI